MRGRSFGWVVALAVVVGEPGCGRSAPEIIVPPACEQNPADCVSTVTVQRGVDILFVIDNSGSMGREQGVLAANFSAFIDVLEREDIGASYRIGVTATGEEVTGELGRFEVTSCRQREEEFTFAWFPYGAINPVYLDERQAGCFDACEHASIDIVPTTTDDDPTPRPRPWLEKTDGKANLPGGVSMTEAFECVGPQGIRGFGLEAPLEAMYRIVTDTGPATGFLRDNAMLAIIIVTDEADCSMSASAQGRMLSEDSRVFWSDPTAPTVEDGTSSAMCWNAGIECSGGPGVYDECHAVDRDFDGNETEPGNGGLYPVSRYVDTLRDLGIEKQDRGGNGQVLVAVLSGVPSDYPETGEVVYRDSLDEAFNLEYGIGPGCGWGTEQITDPPGIPPVRLLDFAEAFQIGPERNVFSICDDHYAVALEQIANTIADLGDRACVPGCVADGNAAAEGFQPDCTLVEVRSDRPDEAPVVPCRDLGDGAWGFPTDVTELCYRTLIDDALSAQCSARGSNLELAIERRDGVPVPPGAAVRVECVLTEPEGHTCDGEPVGGSTG